mmetsp:Transcript_74121/g.222780  ORF Transcript_74121/g.222780 Transcript_74121/m.222780 type:complete len:250 (+) Transcript_74121:264-1013(+)
MCRSRWQMRAVPCSRGSCCRRRLSSALRRVLVSKASRIISVSYSWLEPGHPDPKRFNLNKIAFVLKKYLAKGGRWAVSWDCPSLLQCFCESRWAMLTKEFDFALDLGKADGNGEGPRCHRTGLHQGRRTEAADDAERFRGQELKAKSFTNGKEDRPMVGELYRGAFEKEMGEVTTLHCAQLGWGDEEMVLVSKVIASGALPQLKTLLLAENQIGNEGMNSLCTALLPAGRWRSSGSSPWVTTRLAMKAS